MHAHVRTPYIRVVVENCTQDCWATLACAQKITNEDTILTYDILSLHRDQ
jgi:hypothetical protein